MVNFWNSLLSSLGWTPEKPPPAMPSKTPIPPPPPPMFAGVGGGAAACTGEWSGEGAEARKGPEAGEGADRGVGAPDEPVHEECREDRVQRVEQDDGPSHPLVVAELQA